MFTPQSMMYRMRGGMADGNPYRSRSREQAYTPSGNPNMPIFNQPAAPSKPMRMGSPYPQPAPGPAPGPVQTMPASPGGAANQLMAGYGMPGAGSWMGGNMPSMTSRPRPGAVATMPAGGRPMQGAPAIMPRFRY